VPDCAAIASELAARLFGLTILVKGIDDTGHDEKGIETKSGGNTTRFLIITKAVSDVSAPKKETAHLPQRDIRPLIKSTDERLLHTIVAFSVDHSVGALSAALAIFSRFGINLTSIELVAESQSQLDLAHLVSSSKPETTAPEGNAVFLLECQANIHHPRFQEAVSQLNRHCPFLRILGSFPRHTTPMARAKL